MDNEPEHDDLTTNAELSPHLPSPLAVRNTPAPWLVSLERIVSLLILSVTAVIVATLLFGLLQLMLRDQPTRAPKPTTNQTTTPKTQNTKKKLPEIPSPEQERRGLTVFVLMAGLVGGGVMVLLQARPDLHPRQWLSPPAMPPPPWSLVDCLKPFCLLVNISFLPLVLKETVAADISTAGVFGLSLAELSILLDAVVKLTVFPYMLLIVTARGGLPALFGSPLPHGGQALRTSLRAYVGFMPAFFGLLIVTLIVTAVVQHLTGSDEAIAPQAPIQLLTSSSTRAWVKGIFIISVILGAPLLEEVFFRGLFYGALRRYCTWPLAALGSGLLFGLVHADGLRFGLLAVLGIYLAILRERTRGIVVPILVHTIFNSVQLLFLAIQGG